MNSFVSVLFFSVFVGSVPRNKITVSEYIQFFVCLFVFLNIIYLFLAASGS